MGDAAIRIELGLEFVVLAKPGFIYDVGVDINGLGGENIYISRSCHLK